MPRIAKPGHEHAAKLADEDFYRKHPDRKLKPLTTSLTDGQLRHEWLEMYKRHGGKVRPQVPVVAGKRTTLAACMNSQMKPLEVYVYIVEMRGGDPWGHAGLIVQQKNGTYIRYSQAAANPNLQGWERWQYFAWQQEVVVRQHRGTNVRALSAGGRLIRIPTEHPDQVQRGVNNYITDRSHYNLITNNCAEFVNEVLNQADDIWIPDIPGCQLPKAYFWELQKLYPDCVVVR